MAKYTKAVNLWDESVIASIEAGHLKLQRGQWVQCGSDNLSRLVGITLKDKKIWHIHAIHYPRVKNFCEYVQSFK